MCSGAICGASRGHYGKPIDVYSSGIKWIDDDENDIEPPEKTACEHSNHWKWGNGTRNGQKLYYPTQNMFVIFWELTDEELKEAIDQFDMFSLDMPTKVICENCAINGTV